MRLHFLSELTLNTFIMDKKRVYTFGNGQAEGKADMRNLLGGKGANLAEMNLIGVPVPPGFTITTEVCSEYYELGRDKVVELLKADVEKAIANIESLMNSKFGDIENPLLVSVRSGARASMPGMMDTILNLGLNDEVVEGLSRKTGRPRFAWDSYRRFVQMYGDVVLGMKPVNKEDIDPFEEIIEKEKDESLSDSQNEEALEFSEETFDDSDYKFPSLDLLTDGKDTVHSSEQCKIRKYMDVLIQTLESFGVKAELKNVMLGPAVTR